MKKLIFFFFFGSFLFLGCRQNLYTEDGEVAVLYLGPSIIEFSIPLQKIFVQNQTSEGIGVRIEKKIEGEFQVRLNRGLGGNECYIHAEPGMKIGDEFFLRVWQGSSTWSAQIYLSSSDSLDLLTS